MPSEAHQTMQERIRRCLRDPLTRKNTRADFIHTLSAIGMSANAAAAEVENIFRKLSSAKRQLADIEEEIYSQFSTLQIDYSDITATEAIERKLSGRAARIFSQIGEYIHGVTGKILDYGCGDGQVTQLIADSLKRQNIEVHGVDTRSYLAAHVTVPFSLLDGSRVNADPLAYELAVITNVLHHEPDNQKILDELDRLIAKRLVIIETVPFGEGKEAQKNKDRTFMNDYFYNRLLHDPQIDVAVPGTYETYAGWVARLEKSRVWELQVKGDFGIDQPTIKDRHVIYVLERKTAETPRGLD